MQFYNIYGVMYTKTGALFQREDRGTLYLPHRVEIKSHRHVYVYAISYLLTYPRRSLRKRAITISTSTSTIQLQKIP